MLQLHTQLLKSIFFPPHSFPHILNKYINKQHIMCKKILSRRKKNNKKHTFKILTWILRLPLWVHMIHTEVEGEVLYKTQLHIIIIIIFTHCTCVYVYVYVCDSPECVLFARCFSLNLLQRRVSRPLSCCPQKMNLNNCSELKERMRKIIKTSLFRTIYISGTKTTYITYVFHIKSPDQWSHNWLVLSHVLSVV